MPHLAQEVHLLPDNGHGLFNLPAVRCNEVVLFLKDPAQSFQLDALLAQEFHTRMLLTEYEHTHVLCRVGQAKTALAARIRGAHLFINSSLV